jgi:hypothetical protein
MNRAHQRNCRMKINIVGFIFHEENCELNIVKIIFKSCKCKSKLLQIQNLSLTPFYYFNPVVLQCSSR